MLSRKAMSSRDKAVPETGLFASRVEGEKRRSFLAIMAKNFNRWSLYAWHSLPLALLLTLILLAKLAGETALSGAAHWVRLRGGWLNEHLHLERTRGPAPSTFTSALERIDPQELTLVVQQCLTRAESEGRCGDEPSR
jgi:DDE_Tnp_1-associated